tara:strand:- start:1350 stop:2192 length:843 start_codon:yes stop_codon:yes gene_type:complete
MAFIPAILDKIGFLRNNLLTSKETATNFPDFLGIGAQKSGTTWLYKNLRKHPQLYLPETKEIHYFDWYFYKSINWYYKYFKGAKKNQVTGEINPCYSTLSEKKIKLIHKMNPKLKIILLLRNPIERAWSQAVMNLVKRKKANIAKVDLFSIIKIATSTRKKDFHLIKNHEFIAHFNHPRSIERGNYLNIIKKWEKYFPNNQIFIGDYNQLNLSPDKLLNEIFNFLAIKQVTEWNNYPLHSKINSTKKERTRISHELYEYLSRLYSNDLKMLKEKIPNIKW